MMITKKRWALLLVFVLCLAAAAVPAGALVPLLHNSVFKVGSTTYTVDGVSRDMEVAPYISGDRTMLPLRYVGYALGIEEKDIVWDQSAQTATITSGVRKVQVRVGSSSIQINNDVQEMDVPPEVVDGRIMLPLRSVAEAFSASITWDGATQTINIHY
ncbi:MAG: copper amine oxidase N-terminal domain-containing protein [Firmicutes bacterium]|nr:copper amine oxidase N-terminal domain-containing protein [Bacillota bacterium]